MSVRSAPAAMAPAPSGTGAAVPPTVDELMARVQSGAVAPAAALAELAGLSRPADASLATRIQVARAIAVLRDAGEVNDPQVAEALAGQFLVAAMLIDTYDPLGTTAVFRETLRAAARGAGAAALAGVGAALAGAAAAGRGHLRLEQAVHALASFAHLGLPLCVEAAALALAGLPLSDRVIVDLLKPVILLGEAHHRPGTGALLLTFARERGMSDTRLLAALAVPDPGAAVRLLVSLLGQNSAAANPHRPPLGWDVIAVGLHWLMADGVRAEVLLAAVAAETVDLPADLAAMLRGMSRKIALLPEAEPPKPWHPESWPASSD